VAKFATGHTGTEAIIADANGVVFEFIREVIPAFGHRSDENADTFRGAQRVDVVFDPDNGRLKTEGDFAAIGWQMVSDGVFDDLEQFLLRVGGPDREPMQQLDHQAGETFEGSRNAHGRTDLDQDALDRLDVDLELSGLIDRGIEQSEKALPEGGEPRGSDPISHIGKRDS
jgi:hypothetical protein